MRNVRVFEVDLGGFIANVFGSLRRAAFSGRAEARMAVRMREELQSILTRVISDAIADGSFPFRTGRSAAKLYSGVRVYGTAFNNLKGHIIGPNYILRLEEGGTIYPVESEMLAIPLFSALRPDGTPKLPGPRSWGNIRKTFVYKSKKTGRAYIAYKGADKRLVILYVLVEEVEIKARRFLRKSWERLKPELMAAFGQIMLAEISRVDLLSLSRVTYKGRRTGR